VYYLKRADSRAVNLEQEVRVPVDNAAIFMLCAEGIIYASARRESEELILSGRARQKILIKTARRERARRIKEHCRAPKEQCQWMKTASAGGGREIIVA
jgi:hypothetical protein